MRVLLRLQSTIPLTQYWITNDALAGLIYRSVVQVAPQRWQSYHDSPVMKSHTFAWRSPTRHHVTTIVSSPLPHFIDDLIQGLEQMPRPSASAAVWHLTEYERVPPLHWGHETAWQAVTPVRLFRHASADHASHRSADLISMRHTAVFAKALTHHLHLRSEAAGFSPSAVKVVRWIGASAMLHVQAPPEVLGWLYDSGIGSNVSQGFGMLMVPSTAREWFQLPSAFTHRDHPRSLASSETSSAILPPSPPSPRS